MLTVLSHSLVRHWLTELRDAETPAARFRALLARLSVALFLEASRELPVRHQTVRTPLMETSGHRMAGAPALVPVLRAGLGMVDPILELAPESTVSHVGLYRDHATLEPVPYYQPAAQELAGRWAYVLDPMLATGGSAVATLEMVRVWRPERVKLLGVIGAPEGVRRVEAAFPDVEIYLCALDERLNEIGYIVPGLGDAGDRQFGP